MTTIYHTCASVPDLDRARSLAPSVDHGVATIPERLSHAEDAPWLLDNGAYRAWLTGEDWDAGLFLHALNRAHGFERLPEFVVIPDSPGDVEETAERAAGWADRIADMGLSPYGVIQPGRLADQFAALPESVEGVLVGGAADENQTQDWRRAPTGISRHRIDLIVELARERDLAVHIGRPGANLSWWVHETAVDSLDTASVVRNGYWHRLRRVQAVADPHQETIA